MELPEAPPPPPPADDLSTPSPDYGMPKWDYNDIQAPPPPSPPLPSPGFAPADAGGGGDGGGHWSIWRSGGVNTRRQSQSRWSERGGSRQDSALGPVQYAANALAESLRYLVAVGAPTADGVRFAPLHAFSVTTLCTDFHQTPQL